MKPFARPFALAPDCHTATRYAAVWRRHFYDGMRAAAPDTVMPSGIDFAWARPARSAASGSSPERTASSERLFDQIRAAHADVVISYCFATDVEPALVTRTVEAGVPWINFYCDSVYAFDRVEPLARVTSLNWFPEQAAILRYRALGRPAMCRPYAIALLPDAGCRHAVHACGFVGVATRSRIAALAALRLLGCRPAVRGAGWSGTGGALIGAGAELADGALPEFLSHCRVVLGLNQGRHAYLKLRDVEMPGHGCCYLAQHNEDVGGAFEVGREVLTFRNVAEAAWHVHRLARDPEAARSFGRAARRRVLAEHTWATRLAELARAL